MEQDTISDSIKKPAAQSIDQPEPNVYFANKESSLVTEQARSAEEPDKIVLTITLDQSSVTIFPVLNTKTPLTRKWSWLGVYPSKKYVLTKYYYD